MNQPIIIELADRWGKRMTELVLPAMAWPITICECDVPLIQWEEGIAASSADAWR